MKPTTKLQHRVMNLSANLPKITEEHVEWAKKLIPAYCVKHYSKLVCLECNHSWKDDTQDWQKQVLKDFTCPSCNSTVEYLKYNDTQFRKHDYFCVADIYCEFQIIRYFSVQKFMEKKKLPTYSVREVFQEWDDENPKHKTVVVGHNVAGGFHSSQYGDGFAYGDNFDIKKSYDQWQRYKYNVFAELYPVGRVREELWRNGFRMNSHSCNTRALLSIIKTDPIAETLLKLNQSHLLQCYVHKEKNKIQKYWKELKLCFKNNYEITDFGIWSDYLDNLKYFNKGTNDLKLICPENLKEAHDYWMNKASAHKERMRIKQSRARDKEAMQEREAKAVFLGIKKDDFGNFTFSNKKFTVKALMEEEEFRIEGLLLNHCVHTNDYVLKKDSLILSARIDGKPIETIEVSLSNLSILQARGLNNQPTEHHKEIIALVNKNMRKIGKIVNKKKQVA